MNTLELKGNWNVAKGRLKQCWARFTDDDLEFEKGMEAELIGRIQKRTVEAHEAAQKVVEQASGSGPAHTSHKAKGKP